MKMKETTTGKIDKGIAIACAMLFSFVGMFRIEAALPPVVSQLISVAGPLSDEFGNILSGTDTGADYFGHTVVEGDLVLVYLATDGQVYPPDAMGNPDPRNTLIHTLRIGQGAPADQAQPGIFSGHITPRPAGGATIFVRIFNSSSIETSSYYMDSQLFEVSWTVNDIFTAQFSSPMIPIDGLDDDGDGLNNSLEKSYAIDAQNTDSDGDGMNDADEIIAGTDPGNESSAFVVAEVIPFPPDQVRIAWKSELNRNYTIEKKTGLMDSEFTSVSEVTGNGHDVEVIIPGLDEDATFYRVVVVLNAGVE